MIFKPTTDGLEIKLDRLEFQEIVQEFLKENENEYNKFKGVSA